MYMRRAPAMAALRYQHLSDPAILRDEQLLLLRAFFSGGPTSNRGYPFRGVGKHLGARGPDPRSATLRAGQRPGRFYSRCLKWCVTQADRGNSETTGRADG